MNANRNNPDALARRLQRQSTIRLPLAVAVLMVAALGGLVVLVSSIVQIAGAVVASGELRVTTPKTLIQHPTGGLISALSIANGDRVQEGQVVLSLASEQMLLEREKLLAQLDSLRRQSERLRSILELDLNQDSEIAASSLSASDLESREGSSIAATVARIRTFNQADRSDMTAIGNVLALQRKQIGLLEEQLAEQEDIVQKITSLVSEGMETQIKLQQERSALRSQQVSLVEARKEAAQSLREISRIEAQISKRIYEFQQTSLDTLIKTEDDSANMSAQLNKIDDELAKLDLRAGLSGRITNMSELNIGSVLGPGDIVAEIVPDAQDLLAEVLVPPSQIDLVQPKASAQLELATLKNASEQRLDAVVETIAADLRVLQNGLSAYPVTLRLANPASLPDELAHNGLPVTAYIPTQDRSLAEYLLSPVIQWSRRTFKEY